MHFTLHPKASTFYIQWKKECVGAEGVEGRKWESGITSALCNWQEQDEDDDINDDDDEDGDKDNSEISWSWRYCDNKTHQSLNQPVIPFRLRTGHNRLNAHIYNKF